jgi:hypothetical protein
MSTGRMTGGGRVRFDGEVETAVDRGAEGSLHAASTSQAYAEVMNETRCRRVCSPKCERVVGIAPVVSAATVLLAVWGQVVFSLESPRQTAMLRRIEY